MQSSETKNFAFIDGQNLYLGTTTADEPWEVDLARFREYLRQKYHVKYAFYHLGFVDEQNQDLYEEIQRAGFILVFKQHNSAMLSLKKGNVDSEIIFAVMKRLYKQEIFDKIVLVSGDGDYKILVDFLIEEGRFAKILFPNQSRASSLYRSIDLGYRSDLASEGLKNKIKKEKGSLGS